MNTYLTFMLLRRQGSTSPYAYYIMDSTHTYILTYIQTHLFHFLYTQSYTPLTSLHVHTACSIPSKRVNQSPLSKALWQSHIRWHDTFPSFLD